MTDLWVILCFCAYEKHTLYLMGGVVFKSVFFVLVLILNTLLCHIWDTKTLMDSRQLGCHIVYKHFGNFFQPLHYMDCRNQDQYHELVFSVRMNIIEPLETVLNFLRATENKTDIV